MVGKRLTLSLGTRNEENMQVLEMFYKARDNLGFAYNGRFLKWLLESGEMRISSGNASLPAENRPTTGGASSRRRNRKRTSAGSVIPLPSQIIIASPDGSSTEKFPEVPVSWSSLETEELETRR